MAGAAGTVAALAAQTPGVEPLSVFFLSFSKLVFNGKVYAYATRRSTVTQTKTNMSFGIVGALLSSPGPGCGFLAIPNNSNTHTSFGAWSLCCFGCEILFLDVRLPTALQVLQVLPRTTLGTGLARTGTNIMCERKDFPNKFSAKMNGC